MKKNLMVSILILAIVLSACAPAPDAGFRKLGDENIMRDTTAWGELNTHDPSILKEGDTYYVYSTDASYGNMHKSGVQLRTSKDLITWDYQGPVIENYGETCKEAVDYARLDAANNQGFWAPDIIKVGSVYRLYFSASTFGSSRSCISLAESDRPEGPFQFKGIVVESEEGAMNYPNAIDPAIIETESGAQYMAYGSFFGGIFITELDPETGLLKDRADRGVRIAGSRHAPVEAPVIKYIPETGYYYLFVSYGSLSSDYNVRVARARDVTGPYLDINGNDMAAFAAGNEEKIGTKILGGHTFVTDPGVPPTKGVMAPGHNGILIDGEDYFIVHHARAYTLDSHWFHMQVRRFVLNKDGWPVVMPHRYHGEQMEDVELPAGTYAFIEHGRDSNSESHQSVRVELRDGVISGSAAGAYSLYGGYRITLEIDGVSYDGVVSKGYDGEREMEVVMWTAMSADGRSVWGCTQL